MKLEVLNAYTRLALLLSKSPCNLLSIKSIEFLGKGVSISNLISYQIGWGELLLYWYESGRAKTVITMPGEGFSKWDYKGIAQHFFKKYHFDGSKDQQDYFKSTVERILEIIDKEERSGDLHRVGVWEWCTLPSGKKWPLSKWITVNTCSPYKRAYILIRKFLKEKHVNTY